MVNEAAEVLEEQIVAEPSDVDFAMIMGTGFAPFRGGPLRYADSTGLDKIVGAMENLADRGAAHFEPCHLLTALSETGKQFYPKKVSGYERNKTSTGRGAGKAGSLD